MKKLLKLLSADFHIFSTLLFRGWNIVAGGVLLIGIPYWFTPTEQGYYFTFASLISLQVFFELGFNYVLIQFVAHESANLKLNSDGILNGDRIHLDRLGSLIDLVIKVFRVLMVLFVLLVGGCGYLFLRISQTADTPGWVIGWIVLVIFAGVNLFFSPFMAIMEGLGFVGNVARIRLIQSVVGYIMLWVSLEIGAGLLAVPTLLIVSSVFTGFWLKYNAKPIIQLLNYRYDYKNSVSWIKEIFPFQWKIAISWISGYFIFQIFNPLIFSNQGAVEAGRIGFSLSIFSTILSLSMSWITSKVPVLANSIARNDRSTLNILFKNLLFRSCAFNVVLSLTFLLAIAALKKYNVQMIDRIASLETMTCLLIVCVVNHIIFSVAAYVRAHKEEPLLIQSTVVGLLVFIAVYYGSVRSSFTAILLYTIIMVFVALPWSLMVFRSYYYKT